MSYIISLWHSAVIFSLFYSWAAFAIRPQTKWGPEFTFTNEKMLAAGHEHTSADHIAIRTQQTLYQRARICLPPSCIDTRKNGKLPSFPSYVFTYHDLWSWILDYDDRVIEVQAEPLDRFQWIARRHLVESHIFEFMNEHGLQPHDSVGGGHLNASFEIFEPRPMMFRNFLVFYFNHPELVLTSSSNNPHISQQTPEQYAAFVSVIEEFDRGKIVGSIALADEIEARVYTQTSRTHTTWDLVGAAAARKHQAINLQTITNKNIPMRRKVVELRAVAPQQDFDTWLWEIELFDRIIDVSDTTERFEPRNFNELQHIAKGALPTLMRQLGQEIPRFLEQTTSCWSVIKKVMP